MSYAGCTAASSYPRLSRTDRNLIAPPLNCLVSATLTSVTGSLHRNMVALQERFATRVCCCSRRLSTSQRRFTVCNDGYGDSGHANIAGNASARGLQHHGISSVVGGRQRQDLQRYSRRTARGAEMVSENGGDLRGASQISVRASSVASSSGSIERKKKRPLGRLPKAARDSCCMPSSWDNRFVANSIAIVA